MIPSNLAVAVEWSDWLPWWSFLVAFPAGWCFVLFVISWIGGWRRLARRFPAAGRPTGGETYYLLSGSMGMAQARGTLILTIAPAGLYLTNLFLFRPFHPPLLLPWSGVRTLEQRKSLFGGYWVLVFEDAGTTVELPLRPGMPEVVRAAAGPRAADFDRPPPLP